MTRARPLLIVLAASIGACGKSRDCQRFADRNVEHADAIEAAIVADYERFAELAEDRMGRAPPPRVRKAALSSAVQWRETLTDPLLAQTCIADWPESKMRTLAPCLGLEDPDAYAACVLEGIGVPLLAKRLEGA